MFWGNECSLTFCPPARPLSYMQSFHFPVSNQKPKPVLQLEEAWSLRSVLLMLMGPNSAWKQTAIIPPAVQPIYLSIRFVWGLHLAPFILPWDYGLRARSGTSPSRTQHSSFHLPGRLAMGREKRHRSYETRR